MPCSTCRRLTGRPMRARTGCGASSHMPPPISRGAVRLPAARQHPTARTAPSPVVTASGARRRIGWRSGGPSGSRRARSAIMASVVSADGSTAPTDGAPRRACSPRGSRARGSPSRVIVLLVNVANLVGVGTVVLLLFGVDDGSDEGRLPGAAAPPRPTSLVAFPVGTWAGLRRQRGTNALAAGRPASPTPAEAAQALRLPGGHRAHRRLDLAGRRGAGRDASPPSSFPDARDRAAHRRRGRCSAAMVTAGVTYLLVARAARDVTARALAAHPPAGALTLGVRPRLLLTWGADQRRPDARRRPAVPRPEQPRRARPGRRRLPRRRRAARGRAGHPAHRPRGRPAAARPAHARCSRSATATTTSAWSSTTPARSGCCRRASTRWPPASPSGSGCATCSAGTSGRRWPSGRCATASRWAGSCARSPRCSSTSPGRPRWSGAPGRRRWSACSTGSSQIVVDTVEGEGGLVNKFEGDAALCVFGAPDRPRGPGRGGAAGGPPDLRRRRRGRARSTSGSGVACGRVWAGQVGAASRLEYTVIGDPVNEAARLTELAKDHAGPRRRQRRDGAGRRSPASASTGRATPRSSSAAAARRPRPGCGRDLIGEWIRAGDPHGSGLAHQWWERTTTRTSSACRVPISGSSKSRVRPPRVTDSTMSRSDARRRGRPRWRWPCAGAGPAPGRR